MPMRAFIHRVTDWFKAGRLFNYEIKDGNLVQISPTGGTQKICIVKEIEFWSDDKKLKTVMLGLTGDRKIIIKDGGGQLTLVLSKTETLAGRRD
jgi:hypothetical protein